MASLLVLAPSVKKRLRPQPTPSQQQQQDRKDLLDSNGFSVSSSDDVLKVHKKSKTTQTPSNKRKTTAVAELDQTTENSKETAPRLTVEYVRECLERYKQDPRQQPLPPKVRQLQQQLRRQQQKHRRGGISERFEAATMARSDLQLSLEEQKALANEKIDPTRIGSQEFYEAALEFKVTESSRDSIKFTFAKWEEFLQKCIAPVGELKDPFPIVEKKLLTFIEWLAWSGEYSLERIKLVVLPGLEKLSLQYYDIEISPQAIRDARLLIHALRLCFIRNLQVVHAQKEAEQQQQQKSQEQEQEEQKQEQEEQKQEQEQQEEPEPKEVEKKKKKTTRRRRRY
eukprot:TRINITY_DN9899_c0_g1_i1.p1 TRINITY_DN9899_c0_g1~~TRINITY_DN9899_c0_g1_i1.p1  ORF type:complete len:374 (+),score=121.41 TRINITY_DN9899_c0_g1_i1:103-1122(+)